MALPATCVLCCGTQTVIGTYGSGASASGSILPGRESVPRLVASPLGAALPDAASLSSLCHQVDGTSSSATASVMYVGEDWSTEGDWVGRLGRQYAVLFAGKWPFDEFVTHGAIYYQVDTANGPNHPQPHDVVRRWMHWRNPTQIRCLYDPRVGHRVQSELDDHGEADLGAVPVGRAVERVFELRNAGDARLLVTGVSSTCQCTVADLPTRTLAAGQGVPLRVTFQATRPGPKSQRVVVQTNDPLDPTHVLAVRATATPMAVMGP